PDSYNSETPTMPEIKVTAPKDFSGDIDGVKITLHAQYRDDDGDGNGSTKGDELTDSVYVNLNINTIAGDVNENNEYTNDEDNPVAFISGIKVTDKSADATGGEVITKIKFTLPTDANGTWELTQQPAGADTATLAANGWEVTVSGAGSYAINFSDDSAVGDVLSQTVREDLLH